MSRGASGTDLAHEQRVEEDGQGTEHADRIEWYGEREDDLQHATRSGEQRKQQHSPLLRQERLCVSRWCVAIAYHVYGMIASASVGGQLRTIRHGGDGACGQGGGGGVEGIGGNDKETALTEAQYVIQRVEAAFMMEAA